MYTAEPSSKNVERYPIHTLTKAYTATLPEAVYKAITISFELQKSVVTVKQRILFVIAASLYRRLGLTARRA